MTKELSRSDITVGDIKSLLSSLEERNDESEYGIIFRWKFMYDDINYLHIYYIDIIYDYI